MVVTQIPTVERVFSPPFAKIRSVIDVKYRRVHAQQSMLCNKAITRRNATHLSWSNEHAPRYSPRYPRCGILWILSIDRSIQGNNVASRHGCVPACLEGRKQNEKLKRKEKARSWPRAVHLYVTIHHPASLVRISLYTLHLSCFFFFIYIYQLLLRSITTSNFQP